MSTPTVTPKDGYVNGSDVLLYIDGKAVGHCASHTAKFATETKDRAVKPLASKPISSGLWKGKGVVGLFYSIDAEGLRFYNETECGFKELFALWKAGKSISVKCMERGDADAPYLSGACVITNLEESAPAQDDATYSVSLENDGEPETLDESKITATTPAS